MPSVYLLTVAQTATVLNVSRARVYELMKLGLLPGVRLGRQRRVEASVLRAWIAAGGRGLPEGRSGR